MQDLREQAEAAELTNSIVLFIKKLQLGYRRLRRNGTIRLVKSLGTSCDGEDCKAKVQYREEKKRKNSQHSRQQCHNTHGDSSEADEYVRGQTMKESK